MQALLLIFDRLPYWLLGCYGNLTGQATGFDQLAANGTTFDLCFATDPSGSEPLPGLREAISGLAARHTVVQIVAQSGATGATESSTLGGVSSYCTIPENAEPLAVRVVSALQALAENRQTDGPDLTIVWLKGFPRECPADLAPLVHQVLCEADDVVSRLFERSIAAETNSEHLFLVTAGTGVQWCPEVELSRNTPLRDPFIHIPMLGRIDSSSDVGVRDGALVTQGDILATLLSWFGCDDSLGVDARSLWPLAGHSARVQREAVVIRGPNGHVGIRTPEWYLTTRWDVHQPLSERGSASIEAAALFRKPDDLWDVLDVSLESPQIVESLVEELITRLARDVRSHGVN